MPKTWTDLNNEVTRLTAEFARKDVELKAWRCGLLELAQCDGKTVALLFLNGKEGQMFNDVNDAVDALMAEREVTP